jgi:hypothetical protein
MEMRNLQILIRLWMPTALCMWIAGACSGPGRQPGGSESQPQSASTSPQPATQSVPLVEIPGISHLPAYLDRSKWDELFPNRHVKGHKGAEDYWDYYSFDEFYAACRIFPAFLGQGDSTVQKRELAAFLANIAQETSGGWAEAPGGYFKWGLHFTQEQDTTHDYWDTSKKAYPPVPGRKYFGRGVLQLSGNYNYGQFSQAWFGDIDNLLQHPDHVSLDPMLAFGSGLWFWMTPQYPKPGCHDIMTGKWEPTADDRAKGRLPGFGATLNVINGGIECGKGAAGEATRYRYQYYLYFCKYFHVPPGDNIECGSQQPFGR